MGRGTWSVRPHGTMRRTVNRPEIGRRLQIEQLPSGALMLGVVASIIALGGWPR